MYYIFWVCVCNLKYPARNAHAPYCHLWPARLYNIFPHYLINGTIFGGKNLLNTKCVFGFSLQLLSETFLILIRKLSQTLSKMYICLHVKHRLFVSDFNGTWIFSKDFRKIFKYQISWKSVQREPSYSMLTDGRTDMTKLIVAISQFLRKRLTTYFLPHSKHSQSPLQKSITQHVRVMLLRETIAVTSENRTKHTNTALLTLYTLTE